MYPPLEESIAQLHEITEPGLIYTIHCDTCIPKGTRGYVVNPFAGMDQRNQEVLERVATASLILNPMFYSVHAGTRIYGQPDRSLEFFEAFSEKLRIPILVENTPGYGEYRDVRPRELEEFRHLCAQAGIGMLLDIEHVLHTHNSGSQSFIQKALHTGLVRQVHANGSGFFTSKKTPHLPMRDGDYTLSTLSQHGALLKDMPVVLEIPAVNGSDDRLRPYGFRCVRSQYKAMDHLTMVLWSITDGKSD